MVYHRVGADIRQEVSKNHPVPRKQLVQFERFSVPARGVTSHRFRLQTSDFALTTMDGSKVVYPGQHELIFSTGNGNDVVFNVTMHGDNNQTMIV